MAPTITTAIIYISPNSSAGIVFPGTQKDTRASASQRSLLVNHISTSVKHPKITKKAESSKPGYTNITSKN